MNALLNLVWINIIVCFMFSTLSVKILLYRSIRL